MGAGRDRDRAAAAGHGHGLAATVDLDLDGHGEGPAVAGHPLQRQRAVLAGLAQIRQGGLIEIAAEEPGQVAPGLLADDGEEFVGRAVACRERAGPRRRRSVDQTGHRPEEGLVADQHAQRMGDQRTLVVQVQPRSDVTCIDLVPGPLGTRNDGEAVDQVAALLLKFDLHIAFAMQPAQVERLHIAAEPFMQPHVVRVAIGHLVAEPLVRQLMVQQPVIALAVEAIGVAIGVDGLVLHAQVRGRHHADLLVAEGIGADGRLEEVDHRRELGEQGRHLGRVVGSQMPVGHRDHIAEPALIVGPHLLIRPDVQGDGVGVGIGGAPVPGGPAVAVVDRAHEAPVRRGRQVGRHGDVQVHPFGLGQRVVDTGPEQVAALGLDGGGDPRRAVRRGPPDETSVPRRVGRHARGAGVGDPHRNRLAGGERLGQRDGHPPLGVAPAARGQFASVDLYRRHVEQGVQLDHHGGERGGGGEVEHGDGVDGLRLRHDPNRQIGLVERHGQLFGRARLVAAEGEGGGFAHRRLDHGRFGGGGDDLGGGHR